MKTLNGDCRGGPAVSVCKVAAIAGIAMMTSVGVGVAGSGPDSPTADNNSSPMGEERATRNSKGGDREQGLFGATQSDFVKGETVRGDGGNYGQWLKSNGWTGSGND